MKQSIREAGLYTLCMLCLLFGLLLAGSPVYAQPAATAPNGWSTGKNGATDEWKTTASINIPIEVTFRLRVPVGGMLTASALAQEPAVKPLLKVNLSMPAVNNAQINAYSSDAPMTTNMRDRWQSGGSNDWNPGGGGGVSYAWRFSTVRNLWDESDRADIGAAYAALAPFAEKEFFLRLVLGSGVRQVWLDDRLVSEDPIANPATANFVAQASTGAQILSVTQAPAAEKEGFIQYSLLHYSHHRKVMASTTASQQLNLKAPDGRMIPMQALLQPGADLNLGDSLYRYRMTKDAGPEAPYAGSIPSWPDPFQVDPAMLTFSAPYREYRNAWLLVWVDDEKNAVPKGVFRFYHADAGFCASTNFEVSPEAIRQKLVTALPNRTADGKKLYLIRAPIDTEAYYGFYDPRQRIVDFELSKPVALSRSYPDPIYAGFHPAGLPSSIHVVGITLEEAPFSYEAKPHKFAHTFERPEVPGYTVTVTNHLQRQLNAVVTMTTKSYDGQETHRVQGKATVAPGGTTDVELNFNLKLNGWHEVKVTVEGAGDVQQNTLSLLLLPSNTRTYGYAPNETRFGLWLSGGGYSALTPKDYVAGEQVMALLRKLGIRRGPTSDYNFRPGDPQKYNFLPLSGHTYGSIVWDPCLNKEKDPAAWQKALDAELNANMVNYGKYPAPIGYYFGGEWGLGGMTISFAPWPRYTGDGDRDLTPGEIKEANDQNLVLSTIGRAIRAKYPDTKLYLQWGSPLSTIAHIKGGFPKDLVDGYAMDVPMFAMLPERPNTDDSFQALWELREETKHQGWSRLPINWCEGPFLPTLPGMLSEREQMDNLVRIYLGSLAFGVEQFDCSIQDFDRMDYYGAEHYWSGIYHRRPYLNPKPAAAAVATATSMLCGADTVGGVDTGCLTTYCMAFKRTKTNAMIYALWRVRGTLKATLKVRGQKAFVTDIMGNTQMLPVNNGTIQLTINSSPIWLTGVEGIDNFRFDPPVYADKPVKTTRPLAAMTATQWSYDGTEDENYTHAHRDVRRIIDPNLKAEFGQGEAGHPDAAAITLPVESGDRPLATRYGALVPRKPIVIPGKANALGLWMKGNSSWGRVAFQLRDAKGEIWTSVGTKDAWSCDDTYAWSFACFEGWNYMRFLMPGNAPYDAFREIGTTWWSSRGGDGIVDLPLTLEKVFVEANNEAPYLGEMKLIPNRSYKLSQLMAEYATADDAAPAAVVRYNTRRPMPAWEGPTDNLIAKLAADGVGDAPVIREFTESLQTKDGRSMIIHFHPQAGSKYNLYLARYEDGCGAELITGNVKDADTVYGLRPDTVMYLFLTSVGADNKESKPSKGFKLVTNDNFLQK